MCACSNRNRISHHNTVGKTSRLAHSPLTLPHPPYPPSTRRGVANNPRLPPDAAPVLADVDVRATV